MIISHKSNVYLPILFSLQGELLLLKERIFVNRKKTIHLNLIII